MSALRRFFRIGVSSDPWCVQEQNFTWSEETYDRLLKDVTETKCADSKLNILIIGPKAHGKSSVANSVASYRRQDIPGCFQNFRLCDVRGLTKIKEESITLHKDIESIVLGHVKTGYKMDYRTPIAEDDVCYIDESTTENKVHGVIIVFDITEAYDIHSSHIESIKDITRKLNELNVPVSVLLTKADVLCQRVRDGIENIYHSKKVIEEANKIHDKLGIPRKNIYPVANFEDSVNFGWKESLPLLIALRTCLSRAAHHLYNS